MADSTTWLDVGVEGRTVRVRPGGEWLVGRAGHVQIRVPDRLVSRIHAVIRDTPEGWRITDLDSANGIWREGLRVAHTTVTSGVVVVRLGDPHGPALSLAPGGLAVAMGGTAPTAVESGTAPTAVESGTAPCGAAGAGAASCGPGGGGRYDVRVGAVRIGRALSNGIVLPDLLVSREHAQVGPEGAGVALLDLGSANGTYVNGQPVHRCLLAPGDLISIGAHRLGFDGTHLTELDDVGGAEFGAAHVGVLGDRGRPLLHDVSFTLPPRTFMAIVGPSGAGKTTLLRALAGARPATAGHVVYDGRDLYREYADLRRRIGFVPQEDVLHRVLTVEQALGFGARLRFPPETTAPERAARVREVAAELRLTDRLDARISRLSGGERKRAGTAMELVTRPTLLFLDEPTSGLDVDLDREVMHQLRDLADGGRTVIAVTHNLEHLHLCDVVLVLARGGLVAYLGPPAGVFAYFGVATWADVFTAMKARTPADLARAFGADPGRDRRSFPPSLPPRAGGDRSAGDRRPPRAERGRAGRGRRARTQLLAQLHRQCAVTVADRALLGILTALPAVLALMSLGIPQRGGLARVVHNEEAPQLLLVLVMGASLMGAAGTVRELVKERALYRRECGVGVLRGPYLLAKILFFGTVAAGQGAVLAALALRGRTPAPAAVVLPSSTAEITLVVAGVAVASALLGLLVSAFVRDEGQALPLLVLLTMGQLVGSGGVVPVVNTLGLRELSWVLPARWGFAALSGTVDLQYLRPEVPRDPWWDHGAGAWWADLAGLVGVGIVAVVGCAVLLRRLEPRVTTERARHRRPETGSLVQQ
ncbi:MAG TPA: ATP-binding cassette domain-containing protein [Kineosporiaceae bacterium]